MFLKKNLYVAIISCVILACIGCNTFDEKKESNDEKVTKKTEKEEFKPLFEVQNIPDNIYEKMIGNSIPDKDSVDKNSLDYLKITYYGFDNKQHIGDMVVSKEVSKEVIDIFKELYENKYPIEKVSLIDNYGADDELSMADNNTSSFCYRVVDGSKVLSNHSKGLAIDINPLINPMVKNGVVSPKKGQDYIERNENIKGMIRKGDACYNAFTKRGWTWGGEWSNLKDYQHFEK
ncbi:M15 family metallopeptidase [Paraclostridium bifermentans]|uniref:M15 family metallopeptidase n=1 Tax=Paraclostridium bifermentans TaxID=1490 RepID=A0ABY8R1Z0_PARBF|nr:M15 family metallopeptidase [Paraclostridium bifermentans]